MGRIIMNTADCMGDMERIILRPFPDSPNAILAVCGECLSDKTEIDGTLAWLCDCGQLACTFTWAMNHIAQYHVLPRQAVAEMEKCDAMPRKTFDRILEGIRDAMGRDGR